MTTSFKCDIIKPIPKENKDMLTEFGKLIRKYRIDNNLILKDMADALDLPSSYLSAMEMGRKVVSNDFLEKLFATYYFSQEEQQSLIEAARLSANSVKINLENVNLSRRNMALSFARKFDSLDEETVKKILEYLK